MSAAPIHRHSLVRTAARLFRKSGYSRTGLNEILAESKAPKGSLYHYFPKGKEQLGEESLRYSSQLMMETLARLRKDNGTGASLLIAFAELLSEWMEKSGFQDGCPMATTILETVPQSASLRIAAKEAFSAWRYEFEELLLGEGVPPDDSRRLANLAIAALEGSLIQARVELSSAPILESAQEVAGLMAARSRR